MKIRKDCVLYCFVFFGIRLRAIVLLNTCAMRVHEDTWAESELVRYTPIGPQEFDRELFIYRCLPTALVTVGILGIAAYTRRVTRRQIIQEGHGTPNSLSDAFRTSAMKLSHTITRDLHAERPNAKPVPDLRATMLLVHRANVHHQLYTYTDQRRDARRLRNFRFARITLRFTSSRREHSALFRFARGFVDHLSLVFLWLSCRPFLDRVSKVLPLAANSAQGQANWHQLRPRGRAHRRECPPSVPPHRT